MPRGIVLPWMQLPFVGSEFSGSEKHHDTLPDLPIHPHFHKPSPFSGRAILPDQVHPGRMK